MHWKLIVVGKPALDYAERGVGEYLGRLKRYVKAEVIYLKDGPPDVLAARYAKAAEGCLKLVLDERGVLPTTAEFRTQVDKWEMEGTKRVALMIGPADGHSAALRSSADYLLALSKFTLQHELALVVALEQIYRIYTLKKGEPYHR
jgi:23S rRNA (pseudouridine1915-N3)-methyltransferase